MKAINRTYGGDNCFNILENKISYIWTWYYENGNVTNSIARCQVLLRDLATDIH